MNTTDPNMQKAQQILAEAQDAALDMMNKIAEAKRELDAELSAAERDARESAESFARNSENPDAQLEDSLQNL